MKIEKYLFWILNGLSILIIFQVGLAVIPKFSCSYSDEFINGLNQGLLNLSYSYVAGVIMYLLISYIPELHKKRQIDSMVKPDLELLINEMNVFLFYINSKYIGVQDLNDLKLSDFENMKKFSSEKMDFRYTYTSQPNNTISTGDVTELEYFLVRRDAIIDLINDVFLIPSAAYLDKKLIVCLRNLKNCSLFKFAEYKGTFDVDNFSGQMFEFYKLHILLIDLTKIKPKKLSKNKNVT